ncbi:MAG: DUF975 family protein [bacterium]
MKTENKLLKLQARESLAGKWGLAAGTFAVYLVICLIIGSIKNIGSIISLIISGPLLIGISLFSLSISRNGQAKMEQLFEGFKKFGRSLAAYLMVVLFTLLWSLLLIVPGIIASLSYSQTYYILADDEKISAREAMRKSKKMMMGNKGKYFVLGLSFIGWLILSIFTLGIGLIWLFPYMYVSTAKFYEDIKGQNPVSSPSL